MKKVRRPIPAKIIRSTAFVLCLLLVILSAGIIALKINLSKGPNIVLIGVDTLRADHLSCYGYQRVTSPEIDKLAKEGIQFLECISPIPATTPSFASIFTAKTPISHGVLDNNYAGYRLDDRHLTLAEILKNNGYKTAAFVSGYTMTKGANLTQGFDVYNDDFQGSERRAEVVTTEVCLWLKQHQNERFFLFIHYYDPHGKYRPPPPYNSYFSFTKEEYVLSKIPPYQKYENISDPSFYIAQYDGEISYTDYYIGQFLKELSKLGLDDETLIIFTADHGETMAEHLRWFDHGCFVYEEQLHVPLLLWYPKMFSHKKVNTLVSLIDIFPTVLDILDINFPRDIEGESLLPIIKEDKEKSKFIYCESARGDPERNKEVVSGVKGKQFAIRTKQWKLIRTPNASGIYYELYNLNKDPKESDDLIGKNLAVENQLKAKLEEFVQKYQNSLYYLKKLDKPSEENRAKEILKSLGYL